MKHKNVNYLERNVEKIVLGVAAVFALAIVGYYFVAQPFQTQIEVYQTTRDSTERVIVRTEKKQVGPKNIEGEIKQQVSVLGSAIRAEKSPLPPMSVPRYAQEFETARTAPIAPIATLPVPIGELGMASAKGIGIGHEWPRYSLPTPVAPTKPIARGGFAVLAEPQDSQVLSDYENLIGKQQPRDFHYVSLVSEFNLQGWVNALRRTASPRVPDEWLRGLLLLTDVQVQRQVLDPITGQWGSTEKGRFVKDQVHVVASVPGYPHFRKQYDHLNDPDAEDLVHQLRQRQRSITQPPFPALTSGVWFPADIDASKLTESDKVKLQEVLQRIQEQEQARDTDAAWDSPTTPAAGTPSSPRSVSPARPSSDENRLMAGATVVTSMDLTELYKLRNQILGRDASEDPTLKDRLGRRDLNNVGKVAIETHDLTAQPGQEYRYRLVVGVYNPLFRRRQVDPEQAKQTLNTLAIFTPASAWSDPVRTEPTHYYYLLSATPDLRSATWEIWRIFNGHWASFRHTAYLGDLIGTSSKVTVGSITSEVDFSLPMMLVDLDQVEGRSVGIPTARAVVLNTRSQRLFDRTVSDDAADRKRQQLRDSEKAAAVKAAASATPETAAPTPVEMEPSPVRPPVRPVVRPPARTPAPAPSGR